MSRIGKNLISLTSGVEVKLEGSVFTCKGPRGILSLNLSPLVAVEISEKTISILPKDKSAAAAAMWGTTRALISNLTIGVTAGFKKTLNLVGVGYKAAVNGNTIELSLGHSHQINHVLGSGVSAVAVSPTQLVLEGNDKQAVGQQAAVIRAYRPPEPYKGKGVRYADEKIILKETKKK